MNTDQAMLAARVSRSRIAAWKRDRLLRPLYQIGDTVLTAAEADVRYPGGLTFADWPDAEVRVMAVMNKLVDAGMRAREAGRLARELLDRPGAAVMLAPGIVVRASVCDCPEDCDPFRAEVLAVQRDLRPVVAL